MAMDIVDRLRCILKGNRVAQDAADEIIRLRAALTELERACEHRASLLPRDVYVITEAVPGMRDALTALDDARREAKHALTPNDRVEGRDAALSRRVPSHNPSCGNGSKVGAGDTAKG